MLFSQIGFFIDPLFLAAYCFSIVKTFFSCRQSSGIAFDMPPIVFSIGLFFLDWNFCRLPSGILLMCRHRKYCSLKASLQRQAYCTRAYYRQAYSRQAYCSRGERTNKVSSLYKFPNHFVELWKMYSSRRKSITIKFFDHWAKEFKVVRVGSTVEKIVTRRNAYRDDEIRWE